VAVKVRERASRRAAKLPWIEAEPKRGLTSRQHWWAGTTTGWGSSCSMRAWTRETDTHPDTIMWRCLATGTYECSG